MKKLLLSSIGVCIVFLTQAQYKKGTTFLGGSFSFSHTGQTDINNSDSKVDNYSVLPSIGWAVKDNLVFGINLGFNYQRNSVSSTPPNNIFKTYMYKGGVFLRQYKSLGSGFSLFGQGSFDISFSNANNVNTYPNASTAKGYVVNLGFYPGVAYRINRHWQIETGFPNIAYFNYSHSKTDIQDVSAPLTHYTLNSFSIGSSLSNNYTFTAGILYII